MEVPNTAHAQHPVAVLFTKVGDLRNGGLEDPQAEQPEHRYEREVARRCGICSDVGMTIDELQQLL